MVSVLLVGTISPDTGSRKMRVWSRDCVHQSTSENIAGIEQALAWKPSGSLIASTIRRPNKHEVIFFEKNGLHHGEFTLPFGVKDVKVKEVLWNMESTVLAVWCEDLQEEEANKVPKSYVQLWTCGNYHWYLKQSLHFNGLEKERVVAVEWDPEQAYRLHIICGGGKYLQYTWSWATISSTGKSEDDPTIVSVIDGDRVLMTPTRDMVVPPPMSAYYIHLPCTVNSLAFCQGTQTHDVAILTVDNKIALYKFQDNKDVDRSIKFDAAGGNMFSVCCKTPTCTGIFRIKGQPEDQTRYPLMIQHLTWLKDDLMIFSCTDTQTGQNSVIMTAELETMDEDKCFVIKSRTPVESFIYKMAVSCETGHVAVQLIDGTVLKFNPANEMIMPWETSGGMELHLPLPCTQMSVCNIGGEEVVIGLTERYRFYVNDIEVASNCTSFAVHDEFLLLTTLTHTCRCICRKTKVNVLPTLSDGKAHPFDESIRRVERGSRIVCVVPDDTKLVLQMPRGNLETIHPRALVLSAVRKRLDKLQFKDAMVIMRKHRINLNLIYDHSPENFLNNVETFVNQISSVNQINLFLTDLQEEDVTVIMYTAAYDRNPDTLDDTQDKPSKIDIVCDAVRHALKNIDENKYLLSILTAYVKKTTPELESALLLVKHLRDHPSDSHAVNAEETLKYLLFLVDVNQMFDVALGTYDFDLVLLVAEKSHKDPKEYIPFLNNLRRLKEPYKNFVIEKHLKRYDKALQHVSKCGDEHFPECISLVQEHKLYTESLLLFPVSSQHYKDLSKLYGDYLVEKRRHDEAGIMYIKAEEWKLALDAFTDCCNWRQVFCMTAKLKYQTDTETDIARKLAAELKSKRQHSDAAQVLLQYANDVEEAIVCLIEGCQWDEALRVMYKHNRTDFIETDLKSALVDNYETMLESLVSMQAEFEKYRSRLKVVRVEKEKARIEFMESGGVAGADSDLFSDTSSATGESIQSSQYTVDSSRSTVYSKISGRSAKNQRKADHKRWKLKEGSQFEDLALIAAMSKLIKAVDEMKNEMNMLLKALVQFHYDEKAKELQTKYDKFLTLIEKSIPEVWLQETEESTTQPVLGPMTTANSIAQAVQKGATVKSQETQGKRHTCYM
ncbi:hypothetical protein KUTeg_018059 [Tegillarca granosa]|uniref:Elongator complex protein 1 n=1 Tax=Tegillarca granosa TaxID=220873 RepID=A0ABQ9EGT3_TEGGR|nr:hypothetical protein KUTeg_018059 [Tegillarca granosa]